MHVSIDVDWLDQSLQKEEHWDNVHSPSRDTGVLRALDLLDRVYMDARAALIAHLAVGQDRVPVMVPVPFGKIDEVIDYIKGEPK